MKNELLKKILIIIISIIAVLFYGFSTMFFPFLPIILLPLVFIILLLRNRDTDSHNHKLNKNRNLSLTLFLISLIITTLLLLGAFLSRSDAWGPTIYVSLSFPFVIVCLISLLSVLSSTKKAQEKNDQNLVYPPLYIISLLTILIGLILFYFFAPTFLKKISTFYSTEIFISVDFYLITIILLLIMSLIFISIKKLYSQIFNRTLFFLTTMIVLISFLVTFYGVLIIPDFIDQNKKEKSTENQKVIESLINQQLELYCENNDEKQLSNNLKRETSISNALVEFKNNRRVLYISYPLYQEWVEKYIIIEEYCNNY